MRGRHKRARAGAGGYLKTSAGGSGAISGRRPVYVATLDVGGQDEAATDAVARLENPGRDYTVAHLFALFPAGQGESGPTYWALDVFVDQGSRHFQDRPGRVRLADRLLAWLRVSECAHLVADASGVGAGLVDWLAANMGPERVSAFTFSPAAKAALGSAFLSVIETGRFRYWSGEEEPLSDSWWFFTQAGHCTYRLAEGGRFERDLRWGVPEAARVSTPDGRLPVHDDRLISAALVAVYDRLARDRQLQLGQAKSAVVNSQDPLDNLTW